MLESVTAGRSFLPLTRNIKNIFCTGRARRLTAQREGTGLSCACILRKSRVPRFPLKRTPDIPNTLLLAGYCHAVARREQTSACKHESFVGNHRTLSLAIRKDRHGIECIYGMRQIIFFSIACKQMRK